MELLQIYTTSKPLAGTMVFFGFLSILAFIGIMLEWDVDELKQRIYKYITLFLILCMTITLFVGSENVTKLRVYVYQVTDPYQVEDMLDAGYKIRSTEGMLYQFEIDDTTR